MVYHQPSSRSESLERLPGNGSEKSAGDGAEIPPGDGPSAEEGLFVSQDPTPVASPRPRTERSAASIPSMSSAQLQALAKEKQKRMIERSNAKKTSSHRTSAPAQVSAREPGEAALNHMSRRPIDCSSSSASALPMDAEAQIFQEYEETVARKQREGILTLTESIEFDLAKEKEKARVRRRIAEAKFERDHLEGANYDDDDSPPPEEHDRQLQQPPPPRKRGGKSKAGDSVAQSAGNPGQPVSTQQNSTRQPQSKRRRIEINSDIDKPPTADRGRKQATGRAKKDTGAATRTGLNASVGGVTNLFNSDVFKNAAQASTLPTLPTFQNTKQRHEALRQIISLCPTEDRKAARLDGAKFNEEIKKFAGGGRTVVPQSNSNGKGWLVKGMKTPLYAYQVLGTAFMRGRETGEAGSGGISADEMGLGKTMMMLANIINGLPRLRKERPRTTLIVATPALVTQWASELERHCSDRTEDSIYGYNRVVFHYSGHKLTGKQSAMISQIEEADICFTTYSMISKSYPQADSGPENVSAKDKDEWWTEYYAKNKGILHQVEFLRIVLDEAHTIKNHMSRTSKACRALTAKHRWAITGTPAHNGLSELYSYFAFLGVPNIGSMALFKHNFCDEDDPKGTDRLSILLRTYMIRRTHEDSLFESRLLDLPPAQQTTIFVEFSPLERECYEILKKRFIEQINASWNEQTRTENFKCVWTLLLRLRMFCAHFATVQKPLLELLTREDYEKLSRMVQVSSRRSGRDEALLAHLIRTLENASEVALTTSASNGNHLEVSEQKLPENMTSPPFSSEDLGGPHGRVQNFGRYLKQIRYSNEWRGIRDRATCGFCAQTPQADDAVITSCDHIYCGSCMRDLQHSVAAHGEGTARCPRCETAFTFVRKCEIGRSFSDNDIEDDDDPDCLEGRAKKDTDKSWLSMDGNPMASAKSKACKAQIMKWIKDDPSVKIIVYTQFIDFLRVMKKVCLVEQWSYVMYHGQMDLAHREHSIAEFGENPEKRIMLASLKAGGVGLNLTMASKVICVDPWWNSPVEQQAFCRVFRIGQEKNTTLTRLCVKGTVDEKMIYIKERKEKEIGSLMDNSLLTDHLTTADIVRLFDMVEAGEDGGKKFIAPKSSPNVNRYVPNPTLQQEDENSFLDNEP